MGKLDGLRGGCLVSKLQTVFLTAVLAFGLCAASSAGEVRRTRPSSEGLRCPSSKFEEFLSIYTEDLEIQRSFTNFPLTRQHLDIHAQPEPMPVVQVLSKDQVEFPLIQRSSDRQLQSLVIEIHEVESGRAKITLKKVDADYQVNYFFSRNGCWGLDRIEDWSL